MIKTEMLVPIKDNDGRGFSRKVWLELEIKLRGFGGFTRQPNVTGEWNDDTGEVYRDLSRHYITSFERWEQVSEFMDIVRWACANFRQAAIYIEIAGVPEIIDCRAEGP